MRVPWTARAEIQVQLGQSLVVLLRAHLCEVACRIGLPTSHARLLAYEVVRAYLHTEVTDQSMEAMVDEVERRAQIMVLREKRDGS